MRTAEGTPTSGSSCTFLFRATPRRDPNRTLFVRKPDPRTASRQALRERTRQDLETLRTNRNANPKSQVGTWGTWFGGPIIRAAPPAGPSGAAGVARRARNLRLRPARSNVPRPARYPTASKTPEYAPNPRPAGVRETRTPPIRKRTMVAGGGFEPQTFGL
jgi:hypothetical protein